MLLTIELAAAAWLHLLHRRVILHCGLPANLPFGIGCLPVSVLSRQNAHAMLAFYLQCCTLSPRAAESGNLSSVNRDAVVVVIVVIMAAWLSCAVGRVNFWLFEPLFAFQSFAVCRCAKHFDEAAEAAVAQAWALRRVGGK